MDAGVGSSCATRANGSLYCWGSSYGDVPARVGGDVDWISVSAGFQRCARKQDGSAYCWGSNGEGQLGDGTARQRELPTEVAGEKVWDQVVAAQSTTCGITDNELYCWGHNQFGQLGIGAGLVTTSPTLAFAGAGFGAISQQYYYGCGVTPTGQISCWGENQGGALGRPDRIVPTVVFDPTAD